MVNYAEQKLKNRHLKAFPAPRRARDGFLVVTVICFLVCIIGSIPYLASGVCDNFVDAFFESTSGFTTTGSTVFDNVESLPCGILFWRSLTQWLGGFGIIVFFIIMVPSFGTNSQSTVSGDASVSHSVKTNSHFLDIIKSLFYIYLSLTVLEILLLKIGGMKWFDALIISLSTISTGGFSNYTSSAVGFSIYSQIILIVFMLISGINFSLLFVVISRKRKLSTFFRDEEFKAYLFIQGIASILIFISNLTRSGLYEAGRTLLDSVFQTVSIMTTTGFLTADYEVWPEFSKMILFCLFLIGGCACSSAGGIKVSRVLVCLKLIKRSFSLRVHPNRIAKITINKREIATDTVVKITGFVFIYIVAVFTGSLLVSFDNYGYMTSFSIAMSCLGNLGTGFEFIGPSFTFAAFSGFTKLICSLLMIVGRLEIYTVLVLFTKYYWNPNRV